MSESTAVEKRPVTALARVRGLLNEDAYKARFESVLKERAAQFMASITNLVASEYQLQKCKPESVIAAAFVGACLDLPIDKNLGYAWIVPYGDMATFIIGWKGYVQLALRTGLYKAINAFPVNVEAVGPFDEVGERQIYFDKLDMTKPAVGYCCAWKLTTGFVKVCYWTKEEVDAHAAKYSAAVKAKKMNSPWFTETDKMRLKTVVANSLRKWGIMSIETQQMRLAVEHDQGAQAYIDAEIAYPDNEQVGEAENGGASPDDLAQKLKAEREANGSIADNPPSIEPPKEATAQETPAAGATAAPESTETPEQGSLITDALQPQGASGTGVKGQLVSLFDTLMERAPDNKAKKAVKEALEQATGQINPLKVSDDKQQAGVKALAAML